MTVRVYPDGRDTNTAYGLRRPVTGDVGRVFKAVGIALPPNIREVATAPPRG